MKGELNFDHRAAKKKRPLQLRVKEGIREKQQECNIVYRSIDESSYPGGSFVVRPLDPDSVGSELLAANRCAAVISEEISMRHLSYVLLILGLGHASLIAQEKDEAESGVDQSKILVGQLWEFSDPMTQKTVLLPLYKSLREIETTQGGLGIESMELKQDPNLMSMLQNPGVRQEIGMEDYQFQDLQTKAKELRQGLITEVREALSKEQKQPEQLVQMVGRIRQRYTQELQNAVLPHQMDRLRQVGFQTLIRDRDPVRVLTSEPFKSELKLDEEDVEKLRERSEELKQEFERKVAELRQETVDKLLEELDEEQQKTLREMLGEELDLFQIKQSGKSEKTSSKNSK